MYQCKFSNVTKNYLNAFYGILEEMIQGMTRAELTDSISHNFIVQMIPHHKAAIEMSKNLLQYTTCVPLQNIALQIVEEQTKSIENMLEIENYCSELVNSCEDVNLYERRVGQIIDVMFSEMNNSCTTNQLNDNFMREMIPHHEGAIKMSRNALQYDICPELIPILEVIIASQEKGVIQMKQLLCNRCC